MNAENIPAKKELINSHIDFADEWIISRLNKTIAAAKQSNG